MAEDCGAAGVADKTCAAKVFHITIGEVRGVLYQNCISSSTQSATMITLPKIELD